MARTYLYHPAVVRPVKDEYLRMRGRGFTVIEMLVALLLVAVIAGAGVVSLSNFNKTQALLLERSKLVSLLAKARSLSLAAKDGVRHSVHFEERKAVLFSGDLYSASDPRNEAEALHSEVRISAVSLGGGSEVVFEKLTGSPRSSGTVTLSLVSNASSTATITIAPTGVAY